MVSPAPPNQRLERATPPATRSAIAAMIDHSILRPFATDQEVLEGCLLARRLAVAAVCVRPSDVALASAQLADSGVRVCTVIGFPHGTTTTHTKVAEAQEALAHGAHELDVVLHVGKLKSGEHDFVANDLRAVIDTAHAARALVKVILENCFLSAAEKVAACEIAAAVQADFVKTSTGFGNHGATAADVRLMRAHTPAHMQIKAAGGITDLTTLLELRAAGASRIGCSQTAQILAQLDPG